MDRKKKRKAKRVELWGAEAVLTKSKARATERKRLVKQLDTIFSFYIRMRDQKLRGVSPFKDNNGDAQPIQCCFHILTRSKYKTRWDVRNAIGASFSDNLRYEHDTVFIVQVYDWYKKEYGLEQWDALVADGHGIAKFDNDDLRAIKHDLEKKMQGGFR